MTPTAEYRVVARRYRPQTLGELVGQEHVAKALSGAIASDRVGHAYLFTGARGVGKTSTARILAKALNCVQGPTATPCNECDACQRIAAGDDIDVLEIDGASNRGIDEIRELRANVLVRPSRSRFKIYIIDEVHMLTREAFNALLKTLEEPPEHVKFIFCTTEVEKIPVTILSRCQRFDFAGIAANEVAERLTQIAAAEGVKVDAAAIDLLARRGGGSMRDSQSLLEQLLAFGGESIGVDDVHAMLGTAADQRLGELVEAVVAGDAAGALRRLDAALGEGVDVGRLLEQLLGYLRDVLAAAVGCDPSVYLTVSAAERPRVQAAAERWGAATVMAMMQIIDATLARLRFTSQGRVLAELAIVRLATLERLEQLAELVASVRDDTAGASPSGPAAPRAPARAAEPPARGGGSDDRSPPPRPTAATNPPPESADRAAEAPELAIDAALDIEAVWSQVLQQVRPDLASCAEQAQLELPTTGKLLVRLPASYNFYRDLCQRSVGEFERAWREAGGPRVAIEFALAPEAAGATAERPVRKSRQELNQEKIEHPLVQRAIEKFNARAVRVDPPPESRA